jgi:hypothetical protein
VLEFTITHDIACSVDRFWELFFDPAFTQEMIVGGLGFASCDIDEVRVVGSERHRQMRVIPKLDIPAPVAKLLGPKLGYTEHGVFDEETRVWDHHLQLSVLSDRIRMGGKVRAERAGDDRCRRIADLWCEAKIFGLGKMVEKAAEKNMRDGWGRSATWMNDWLAKHSE